MSTNINALCDGVVNTRIRWGEGGARRLDVRLDYNCDSTLSRQRHRAICPVVLSIPPWRGADLN